ncbi:MAG: hypothetical protein ACRC0I_06995 [Sediminibacterium sp.]|jgi:hypothetical protein|nr:hypothetical protein [Chitinophagaceae bacterium]MCA6448367.1 hypothetical protein [Chitinophagaceae bacterium]
MRYLKIYTSVFFFLLLASLHAQIQESEPQARKSTKPYVTGSAYFDSLKNQKPSIKPTGDFDQRFSFIGDNNKDINIWGYRVGLLVNDKYKFGIGGYTFNADFDAKKDSTRIRTQNSTQTITNISQVSQTIFFGTVYIEPYLIRRRRWEMSMVMEIGYGKVKIDSSNSNKVYVGTAPTPAKNTSATRKEPFIPIGMGLSFNLIIPDKKGWHFLTYFGLNAIVGMRTVIYDTDLKQNYSGFYYSLGTAIYIDRIFTDITGKKKQKKAASSPSLN